MGATVLSSRALQAANQQLLQRRAQQQANKAQQQITTSCAKPRKTVSAQVLVLPSHLGWDSHAVTSLLRATSVQREEVVAKTAVSSPPSPPLVNAPSPAATHPANQAAKYVKLYPDLALAMLRHNLANAGRVWLLLHQLDQAGSGWLTLSFAQTSLTEKASDWHICGIRQLRNILKQGEHIFWYRDQQRIWLRSVAKVAASLDLTRLKQRPVFLPQKLLCGSMGTVKAHFYASFHSSRRETDPISREKLEQITGIPQRTQRAYEQIAGIEARRHVAVGGIATPERVQERAWRQGQALFLFTDFLGKQGSKGRQYVAWHLPNSYTGCHRPAPKGRMRKTNRQIDLVIQRARGNSYERLFYENGARAVQAFARDTAVDRYWPTTNQTTYPRTNMWSVVEPIPEGRWHV